MSYGVHLTFLFFQTMFFKNVFVLCGTDNLLLDSHEDIADGILEIAKSFKTNYSYVNVVICGILARDDRWSVNGASIKEVNQILK